MLGIRRRERVEKKMQMDEWVEGWNGMGGWEGRKWEGGENKNGLTKPVREREKFQGRKR